VPIASTSPAAARRSPRLAITLRSRLLLLVCISVLPLVALSIAREANRYGQERAGIYENLLTIARGTAVAVERDFQLRTAALETLALSPALQDGDFQRFDPQALAFLRHQPKGAILGITGPDLDFKRAYVDGRPPATPPAPRAESSGGRVLFQTGRPGVMNLHSGNLSPALGFSVDVPVLHDGRVQQALFIRLLPAVIADLLAGQKVAPGTILAVFDATGTVVARIPGGDRFVGAPVMPDLWRDAQARQEGTGTGRTLDGTQAVFAFTRIGGSGWGVFVGAPEEAVFAPLRSAIARAALTGALVLAAGLLLAMLAARAITRPIQQLARLAETDDASDAGDLAGTLPETSRVASALLKAAADRRDAARALADSEQLFRALFERSPTGTMLVDPDTARVIDCNEAVAAFFGQPREAIKGTLVTDFEPEADAAKQQQVRAAIAAGQTVRYETRVSGHNGPRDIMVAIAPAQVGDRILLLVSQIDVTDLRQAQAVLRINQERLELAREGADLGIWDWDITSGILSWSDHDWHLHGLSPVPGGPSPALWESITDPADIPPTYAELREAIRTPGRPFAVEYTVLLPGGARRRLMGRGQAIRDASGEAVRMVGINMDVTARYEAEQARDRLISALETERARLADIIEALPVGVGIVDAQGRVVLGNAVLKRFVGPVITSMDPDAPDTWIGRDPDGTRVRAADLPGARALRGQTVLPGQELLYRAPDGTGTGAGTWLRVGARPLLQEEGKVREALIVVLDIDAEKRLLDLSQQANDRLEQRVQQEMAARESAQARAAHAERMHALGQIAGGIAHDFNNVLQAVSSGTALIERRPEEPDRVLQGARMVADAARRGAAITSRLLAFARRGDLCAEPVDPAALLADMAEVLTHTLGGSVACRVDVPPGLPPLLADRGQLETALVNLATNARDAMPDGGVLTMAAATETVPQGAEHPAGLAAGDYVRLCVRDTGTGMDGAVLARVTEPFFTTKEPGKGTGLGLAMAKGFAEQSGGSLSIDSAPGRGTAILLWLPASAAPAPLPPVPADRSAAPDRPVVLLVDDDRFVREILTMSLEDSGHAVLAADSGAAAMALLLDGAPADIVVTDLTMPGMDGIELIRRAQGRRPHLPAILLTGYAGDGAAMAVGGAVSGAYSLLQKPVTGAQLSDRIAALLGSRVKVAGA
jgi:PAS domain S-box-containing protein